ncbi:MAG: asparagine synthase (glutamine-hydrolyzing) [Phycisphaerales bacterium]|nr:asparagine synthase (glutamine-hydrolyzing) [Phycisphaerales bacterium]
MCGICGMSFREPGRVDANVLARMTSALAHRGPDDDGTFLDDHTGLGFRRLSIIDLTGGAQPMFNEAGSIVIVFNGEIYNYVELVPELKARGHRFATVCDTEVVLHLYEDHGPDCVRFLNGMFAFAIWDRPRKRLFIARDRLGERPLFYHFDAATGGLRFASELKALVHDPAVGRGLSVDALDDYLAYGYVPTDRCIFDGASKLPPAHRLIWEDGRIVVEPYWRIQFDPQPIADEDAWIRECESRLRDAIRIRLRSDVPLGVFLSGGVDSSAMVALACGESAAPLRTFSVGFQESEFDEMRYARLVADRFQTDHTEIEVTDRDVSVLSDLAYYLDEPFADPSALPTYYVCREARRHVTVCVSGDGGDELFAGYSRYRHALEHQRWDRITRLGIKQLCGAVGSVMPRHYPGAGFLQRTAAGGADRYFAQCAKFLPNERRRLFRPEFAAHVQDRPRLFERYFANGRVDDLVTRLQHADQETYLVDDILVKVDRMSMKQSLEVRVPFLDHTLVEFVNRAPSDWKLRRGVGKYPLKRLLAAHLPPELLTRRKMGFGLPIKHWFRGSLDAYARDHLLSADTHCTRWIRPQAVAEVLADHQRGGRDLSRKVWALLLFELWCRRFNPS